MTAARHVMIFECKATHAAESPGAYLGSIFGRPKYARVESNCHNRDLSTDRTGPTEPLSSQELIKSCRILSYCCTGLAFTPEVGPTGSNTKQMVIDRSGELFQSLRLQVFTVRFDEAASAIWQQLRPASLAA